MENDGFGLPTHPGKDASGATDGAAAGRFAGHLQVIRENGDKFPKYCKLSKGPAHWAA